MPRREYAGGAPATTLDGALTAGSATIVITDGTSWPTGTNPFVVIIDRGKAAEEKVLITSRSGNTLTVNTRGFDSTTAAAHADGATIEHGLSAADIDEVNDHVFDTTNDDHTQYLNTTRHAVEARHTFGAALGTPATPTEMHTGTGSAGSGDNPSREDHAHPHNPPAVRVFGNAQSISDATLTTVTSFDTERFDTDSMWEGVTNPSRITFTTAGIYAVNFVGHFASAGDYARVYAEIRLNGATRIATDDKATAAVTHSPGVRITTIYKFAAADYVEVRVFHDNTASAARDLLETGNFTPEFSAVWVGTGN